MRVVISAIRIFFFAVWSVSCILIALLACLLTFSKKPTLFLAKYLWSPIALPIMGARLEVEGIENIRPDTPYVVMSNHCSYLDIPSLLKSFPIYLYFIAKKELRRMPFLGWFLIISGMIFIDRKNTAAAKESLADAAKLIRNGKNVIIFPEGTASPTGEIIAFKKGGFHLAEEAQVPILPVRIVGTFQIFPSSAKLNMRRGKVTVIVGKPIMPDVYKTYEMNARIEFVRQTIIGLADKRM